MKLGRFAWGAAIAASVMGLALAARAEVVPAGEEIMTAFVGRTVWANTPLGRFTISHSRSGDCSGIIGRDGGTQIFRGRCEISDGKICYTIPQITPFCLNVRRDGTRYYYITRAGNRVYFEY